MINLKDAKFSVLLKTIFQILIQNTQNIRHSNYTKYNIRKCFKNKLNFKGSDPRLLFSLSVLKIWLQSVKTINLILK